MIKGDLRWPSSKMLADDLTYTHSSALFESKAQFIASVTSGNIDHASVAPSESDWKSASMAHRHRQRRGGGERHRHGKDLKFKIRYTTIHTNHGGSGSCRPGKRHDFRRSQIQQLRRTPTCARCPGRCWHGACRWPSSPQSGATSCSACCGGSARGGLRRAHPCLSRGSRRTRKHPNPGPITRAGGARVRGPGRAVA